MNKKVTAIILEIIPIISAPLSYLLIVSAMDSRPVRAVIAVTMALAFFGFVFFFIGRKLAKEEKVVRILGIFDILTTVAVIGFYVLAFLSVAL
ncbi:MAG: hypothetical protein IK078_10815 [Lachnospiraceae bacterium]|nr:hypothetical protein [Lachnospiraceae bacterium]